MRRHTEWTAAAAKMALTGSAGGMALARKSLVGTWRCRKSAHLAQSCKPSSNIWGPLLRALYWDQFCCDAGEAVLNVLELISLTAAQMIGSLATRATAWFENAAKKTRKRNEMARFWSSQSQG